MVPTLTKLKTRRRFFKYANGGWTKQNQYLQHTHNREIGNLVQEDVWTKLKTINEKARHSSSIDPNTHKKSVIFTLLQWTR
ncbi:MAG: hypothetical protein IPL21_14605 [Saprospirales bacterium]|nr:hypothetical protein [Saprospirales bacterium]